MKKFLSMILLSSSLVFADNNTIGLDTVVGATIGVAIGNQIGKGNGKVAAKVIGGLIGASVANNMRNYERVDTRSYRDDYYTETKSRNICKNRKPKIIRENVLKGYENYFTYKGNRYMKFSDNRLSYVEVRTKINF